MAQTVGSKSGCSGFSASADGTDAAVSSVFSGWGNASGGCNAGRRRTHNSKMSMTMGKNTAYIKNKAAGLMWYLPVALIWAASWNGILTRRAGTAPATVRGSTILENGLITRRRRM